MTQVVTVGRGAFKESIQDLCSERNIVEITNAGEVEHVMTPMDIWVGLTASSDVNAPVVEVNASNLRSKLKDTLESGQVIVLIGPNGRQTHTIMEKSIYDTLVAYSASK